MTRWTVQAGLLATALGVLVVAPWTRGSVLLLDWVAGPQELIVQGTAPPAMPLHVVLSAVPPQVAAWLAILAYFPLAGAGAAAMVGGSRWRRYGAALFMVCNPVVIDRLRVGHIAFLLGLAVLPWLVASLRQARERGGAVRPAAWFALAVGMCAATGWLAVVVVLVVGLLPRPRWRDLARCAVVLAAGAMVAVYPLVLRLTGAPVDSIPAPALSTRGGLWAALTLRGFWRSDQAAGLGWLLLLAAVVGGFVLVWRTDWRWPALLLTGIGLLWALGGLPPRLVEAQQWIGLALLGYTIAFAFAVEWSAERLRSKVPIASAVVAATPLLLAPGLVWGAGIPAAQYPLGWYAADLVMGSGQGSVLFLPWHAYQPFRFTGDRAVATPGSAFFRRPVLTNDAVELPTVRTTSESARTAYVTRLLADGGGGHVGPLVAPLGAEFIVVARSPAADAYAWLDADPTVVQVLSTETMAVYRVLAQATGRVAGRRVATYDELLAAGDVGSEAVTAQGQQTPPVPSNASGGLTRQSPHSWQVAAGTPGWLVVPEDADPGWQLAGRSGEQTVAGTMAFEVGPEATEVTFQPWRLRLLAQAVSLLALVGLLVAAVVGGVRAVAGRRRDPAVLASEGAPAAQSGPAIR